MSSPRTVPSRAPRAAAVLVLLAVTGLVLAHRVRAERSQPVEPPPPWWVDPGGARLGEAPSWIDPRWSAALAQLLERRGPFAVDDAPALEGLAADLSRLSFVHSVATCAADARHGLVVELRLRRPVACIPVAGGLALVDADGVVLDGRWDSPPRLGDAFLPVIGRAGDPLLARARPGDWLAEPEHVAALDVAQSMAAHLSNGQRAALGRVGIDARGASRASVEQPGVRLELEGGRVALFGRAPSADEPGELPAAHKWRSLVSALEVYRADPARDWQLVDLRWDRPDMALRVPELVAAQPAVQPEPRVLGGGGGRRPEPRATPQVR